MLFRSSNFEFIEKNICQPLVEINYDFDIVFHAASPASPPKYLKYAVETMDVNSIGTRNMIDVALKSKSRFIFFSTSEIYGDPLVHPQKENYFGNVNTIGPRSVYDESKRFGEALVSYFAREQNLNAGIIRIFNTYGPRLDPFDGRVISTFIRQALKNEALTLHGDGSQTRSFCYIDDLIDGIVSMSKVSEFGPINLGNINEISLNELIVQLESIFNKKLATKNLPALQDDPMQRKPDISKAQRILNWKPKVNLIDGLKLTINSFQI